MEDKIILENPSYKKASNGAILCSDKEKLEEYKRIKNMNKRIGSLEKDVSEIKETLNEILNNLEQKN